MYRKGNEFSPFFPQFYILENALELYARDMLFLSLSLETPKRMGLQGKWLKIRFYNLDGICRFNWFIQIHVSKPGGISEELG